MGKAKKGITFTWSDPGAQSVHLSGSFNQWDPDALPLCRDKEGIWYVTVDLPAGRHEYKFLVDGGWCCTPGCAGSTGECSSDRVPNPFGSMNHVLEVGQS